MDKEEFNNLSEEEQKEIYRKCKESPAYFYNNFVRKEGHPEITDEQFEETRKQMEQASIKRRYTGHIYRHPILLKDAIK